MMWNPLSCVRRLRRNPSAPSSSTASTLVSSSGASRKSPKVSETSNKSIALTPITSSRTSVTFKVAAHESESYNHPTSNVKSPVDVLKRTWGSKQEESPTKIICKDLIQSSLPTDRDLKNYFPQTNGFLHTIVTAYNSHHNLVIRPDDVWIAILSQFYLYVTANAEELRSKFVAHKGKERITVYVEAPDRYHVSYDWMAEEMTKKMKEKLVDPELQNFIIPKFSTTTPVDTAIGSIMMMGTLKHYFEYYCMISCGIPSVTLLGKKEDYEEIYRRLDKLEEFGAEPRAFAALLRPILREFIAVFTVKGTSGSPPKQNIDFWNRICHFHPGGSGPDYLSGWATAFCPWNNDGKWVGPKIDTFHTPVSDAERSESAKFYEDNPKTRSRGHYSPPALFLDNVRYPVVEFMNIPNGFCDVDVTVNDHGTEYNCMMVAGHMGFVVTGERNDTLLPSPQWFMFEKQEVTQGASY